MSFNVKVVGKISSLFTYKCAISQRINGIHQNAFLETPKTDQSNIPQKPKRPLSAYFRFLIQERPIISKEYPHLKQTEVTRRVAQKWANSDESVKSQLLDDFRKDQETYRNAIEKYDSQLSDEQKESIQKEQNRIKSKKVKSVLKKKKESLNKPKKPMNAFFLFGDDLRPKYKNSSITEFTRIAKEKWSKLSESDKEEYKTKAAKLLEQYKIDLMEWEKRMIADGELDVVRNANLNKKRSKKDNSK